VYIYIYIYMYTNIQLYIYIYIYIYMFTVFAAAHSRYKVVVSGHQLSTPYLLSICSFSLGLWCRLVVARAANIARMYITMNIHMCCYSSFPHPPHRPVSCYILIWVRLSNNNVQFTTSNQQHMQHNAMLVTFADTAEITHAWVLTRARPSIALSTC